MAKVQIIIGTVDGHAFDVAATVLQALQKWGHEAWLNVEPQPQHLAQDADEILLVCTSTTGDGQLPRQLYPLFLALDDQAVNLRGRFYGVIALGDSSYPKFARAGFTLEGALYMAGGKRLGEMCVLDAQKSDDHAHAVLALKWAKAWIAEFPTANSMAHALPAAP